MGEVLDWPRMASALLLMAASVEPMVLPSATGLRALIVPEYCWTNWSVSWVQGFSAGVVAVGVGRAFGFSLGLAGSGVVVLDAKGSSPPNQWPNSLALA